MGFELEGVGLFLEREAEVDVVDEPTADLSSFGRPTERGQIRGWLIHHVNLGLALKEKTDTLKLEAHLKYPGAKTKYQSQVEFFVDKLLEK